MARRWVLLLLAASFVAPTTSASETPRTDTLLRQVSGEAFEIEQTVAYEIDKEETWSFWVPSEASFVEARDANARPAQAIVRENELLVDLPPAHPGSLVLLFRAATTRVPPFTAMETSVSGHGNVTVRAQAAPGWRVVGYAANDGANETAPAAFTMANSLWAHYLVLPEDDPGAIPLPPLEGGRTRWRYEIAVKGDDLHTRLHVAYDTDRHGPAWWVAIPPAARNLTASTPLGPLRVSHGSFETQYLEGYRLGVREFSIEHDLALKREGESLRTADLLVGGDLGEPVEVVVGLPANATLVFVDSPQLVQTAPGRFVGDGPGRILLSLLVDRPGASIQSVPPFLLATPDEIASLARELAVAVAESLDNVTDHIPRPDRVRPIPVQYTSYVRSSGREAQGSYEEATDSIRVLDPRRGVNRSSFYDELTLIHEAAHALFHRSFGDATPDPPILDEGLAVLAETRYEIAHPEGIPACTGLFCQVTGPRPAADELLDFYERMGRGEASFDVAWPPHEGALETIYQNYELSGLFLHAFWLREGSAGVVDLLTSLASSSGNATQVTGEDVVQAVLARSPGMDRQSVLHPGIELSGLDLAAFSYCMGELVRPASVALVRIPREGCGTLEAGARPTPKGFLGLDEIGAAGIATLALAAGALRRRR